MTLAVLATHPIQYHAPVYRVVQQQFNVPVTAIYGSDFSVAGYRDEGFGVPVAWDTDLLSGYQSIFLSRTADDGAHLPRGVTGRGLDEALRRIRPQAILLTGYALPFHRQAIRLTRGLSVPLLFRAEVTDHARVRHLLKQLVRDVALYWLYRRFARLLYIGQRSHAHYRRLGCDEERLLFSPYCVDVTPFQIDEPAREALRPVVRAELQVAADQFVVAFVGKLMGVKAPHLLLEAVKQLPDNLRERLVVLWVGDGELRPALEQLAASAPAVASRFVGFQNQRALSRYYHASDMLVLPSVSDETWGLVVNEALQHGVPCVVSNGVGCAPDLIESGRTGEVFETGSASSLSAALERFYHYRSRAGLRDDCRRKVSGYSVAEAAAGLARAYQQVAD